LQLELFVTSKTDNKVQSFRCELRDRLILGRGPESPVPLEDSAISREHLAFWLEAGAIFAADLSNNGSWVNGTRIPRSPGSRVAEQDSIEVPGYEIRFRVLPDTAAETAPASLPPAAAQASGPASAGQRLSAVAGAFSGLEKFLVVLALVSLGLLVYYLGS